MFSFQEREQKNPEKQSWFKKKNPYMRAFV